MNLGYAYYHRKKVYVLSKLSNIRAHMRPYLPLAFGGMVGKAIEVVFEIITPLIIARLIDDAIATHNSASAQVYCVLLVVCAGISYCCTLVCQYVAARTSQRLAADIRRDVLCGILNQQGAESSRFSHATLLNACMSDTNQLQLACALAIRQLIRCPLLVVMSLISAFFVHAQLASIMLVCVALVCALFWAVMRLMARAFGRTQRMQDNVSTYTLQFLRAQGLIRMSNTQEGELASLIQANSDYTAQLYASARLSTMLSPLTFFVMNAGICCMLWLAAGADAGAVVAQIGASSIGAAGGVADIFSLISLAPISQGMLVCLINYMTQTCFAIIYIANLLVLLSRGYASAQRIENVLASLHRQPARASLSVEKPASSEPLNQPTPHAASLQPDTLALECCSVWYAPSAFAHHNTFRNDASSFNNTSGQPASAPSLQGDLEHHVLPALSNISCTFPRSGLCGVVGPVGSGKSTFLALCAGLIEPRCGQVLYGGCAASALLDDEYCAAFCLISQQPQLIEGSIKDNICLRAPDASDEEIAHALAAARADEIVSSLDSGLHTYIPAHSRQFSGGQIQRLCLARAFIRPAKVLLLDDCTSALDAKVSAQVLESLYELAQERLVLFASSHVQDVQHAHTIIVLNNGSICAQGTHEELLEHSSLYRELCGYTYMGSASLSVNDPHAGKEVCRG